MDLCSGFRLANWAVVEMFVSIYIMWINHCLKKDVYLKKHGGCHAHFLRWQLNMSQLLGKKREL